MSPMELVLKHPNDAPAQRAKDLVVVVACEDGTTAPRACSLLQRVARNAGLEGRLVYSWLTFAVLASPSLRHLASTEAAAADMIVVAAREGRALPEAVKNYLRLWVANPESPPRRRALVALLESDPKLDGVSRGVVSELKRLAESGGVDFFGNGDEVSSGAALVRGPAPPSGNSPGSGSGRPARIAGRPVPQLA